MYISLSESMLMTSNPYRSFVEHFSKDDYNLIDDAKYLSEFIVNDVNLVSDCNQLILDFSKEFNIKSGFNSVFKEDTDTRVFAKVNSIYHDDFEDDESNIFDKAGKVEGEKKSKLNFILSFIKKVISLKGEDLEATNKLRFKALRMALGLLIIGGTLLMPGGLLMNLVKVIVISSVAAYSLVRLSKVQDMLETQVERLDARIEEEDDPKVKADLMFAVKGIRKELTRVTNRRKKLASLKRAGRKDNSDSQDW